MAQVVPIALGAIQVARGLGNEAKLNKESAEAEKNKPVKQTSQFDRDALLLSESELANGMSAGASRAYDDSVDRGLSSSISAILKGGGSLNNIGDVYDATEQGRANLAVIQDQLRLSHINNVLKEYGNMSSEEEKNWLVNNYAPYKDKLQAIGAEKKANANLLNSGLNTFGGAVTNLLGGEEEQSKLNNFLNSGQSTPSNESLPGRVIPASTSVDPQPTPTAGLDQIITKQPGNYLLNSPAGNNDAWGDFWKTYNFKI
jgi:hypothetical protein